ncbi:MAG: hypothetical protein JKY14_01975 [Paraglaciecola sp.]|nr:hypothetical protein [Paraglaciecola sp.]
MLPGVHDDFDPIAAYVLNPQLPLWAGDNNQTFNYPQYDPGNWSRAVHQYGSYVFFIYLQEFVMDKKAVATMISQSWSEQTSLFPQQVLFNKLASLGFSMASIFADFAAHNVTWDYKNDVDAYKYWEQRWTADMDSYNEANKTIASHTTSTDGWQAPPNELLPSAWAYNVVELNSENNASVLIEFNADEHGNAGTSSQFEVRVIIESGDSSSSSEQRTYSSLNIEDGQASQSFQLNQGQTLWLVVASVPNLFSGNETFNYQYKMTLKQ